MRNKALMLKRYFAQITSNNEGEELKKILQILIEREKNLCGIRDLEIFPNKKGIETEILLYCINSRKETSQAILNEIALLIIKADTFSEDFKLECLDNAIEKENVPIVIELLNTLNFSELAHTDQFVNKVVFTNSLLEMAKSSGNVKDYNDYIDKDYLSTLDVNKLPELTLSLQLNFESKSYEILKKIKNNDIMLFITNQINSENLPNFIENLPSFIENLSLNKCWNFINCLLKTNMLKHMGKRRENGVINSMLVDLCVRTKLESLEEKELFETLLQQECCNVSSVNNLLLSYFSFFSKQKDEIVNALFNHKSINIKISPAFSVTPWHGIFYYVFKCLSALDYELKFAKNVKESKIVRDPYKKSNLKTKYLLLEYCVPTNLDTIQKVVKQIPKEDYECVIDVVLSNIIKEKRYGKQQEICINCKDNINRWKFLHALLILNKESFLKERDFKNNVIKNCAVKEFDKFCCYSEFSKEQAELFYYFYDSLDFSDIDSLDFSDIDSRHQWSSLRWNEVEISVDLIPEYMLSCFCFLKNQQGISFFLEHKEFKITSNMPLVHCLMGKDVQVEIFEKILNHKSYDIKNANYFHVINYLNPYKYACPWESPCSIYGSKKENIKYYVIFKHIATRSFQFEKIKYDRLFRSWNFSPDYSIAVDTLKKPKILELLFLKIPVEDRNLVIQTLIECNSDLNLINYFVQNANENYFEKLSTLIYYGIRNRCVMSDEDRMYCESNNEELTTRHQQYFDSIKIQYNFLKEEKEFIDNLLVSMFLRKEDINRYFNLLFLGLVCPLSRFVPFGFGIHNCFFLAQRYWNSDRSFSDRSRQSYVRAYYDSIFTLEDVPVALNFRLISELKYSNSLANWISDRHSLGDFFRLLLYIVNEKNHFLKEEILSSLLLAGQLCRVIASQVLYTGERYHNYGEPEVYLFEKLFDHICKVRYFECTKRFENLECITEFSCDQQNANEPDQTTYNLGKLMYDVVKNGNVDFMEIIRAKLCWDDNFEEGVEIFNKYYALAMAAIEIYKEKSLQYVRKPMQKVLNYVKSDRELTCLVPEINIKNGEISYYKIRKHFIKSKYFSLKYLLRFTKNISECGPKKHIIMALLCMYTDRYLRNMFGKPEPNWQFNENSLKLLTTKAPAVLSYVLEFLNAPKHLYNIIRAVFDANSQGDCRNNMKDILHVYKCKVNNICLENKESEGDNNPREIVSVHVIPRFNPNESPQNFS